MIGNYFSIFFTSLYSLMDWNADDCFFGLYTYFGMLRFALKVIIDAGKCGRERQWAVIFDLFNQTLALISKLLEVIRWSLFFHCMRKNPQFFFVCVFFTLKSTEQEEEGKKNINWKQKKIAFNRNKSARLTEKELINDHEQHLLIEFFFLSIDKKIE